ncbi:hypothetical protein O0L34_g13630 [Tuta absoluta]|nr:hypothetical protein O0L34_g13630 [Tuta absoluta]
MLFVCFFVAIIVVSSASRFRDGRTYTLVGYSTMTSRTMSCHNWGERVRTNVYQLPHLNNFELSYSKLSAKTIVIAIFNSIDLRTEYVKNTELSLLVLDEYSNYDGAKEYSKTYGYVSPCDFKEGCKHSSLMKIKLKITRRGSVKARIQVYAAAWRSNSCAISYASVDSFQITTR